MRFRMIFPIKALKDNYIWSFIINETKMWVVDPGEAEPVIQQLTGANLKLEGILLTHHHYDHTNGVEALINYGNSIQVIGSHRSPISFINQRVKEGDNIDDLGFNVLEIPGHTLDHIAFYNAESLFCGDTLFSAGCGKVFEGTTAQMYHSLMKLRSLPSNTKIYCGHEYTLANLRFAKQVEPANDFIQNKLELTKSLIANHQPSLPSLLCDEVKMNPFLRCDQPSVRKAAEHYSHHKLATPEEVFAVIRSWKNANTL